MPLGLLVQAAGRIASYDAPDDTIRAVFTLGLPQTICICNEPDCYRGPKRVAQTMRLLSYAVDEIACLIHSEPEGELPEDQLEEFIAKATDVAKVMMGLIVDAGMHRAFVI